MLELLLKKCRERKWEVFLLVLIIAGGVFLRTYHFSDWLLFEIDQTYDTRIVSNAIENGIGNLPLLGPTAGGGRALRLGPAFYYMEYASALIFGNTPVGHAALVLILSILAIPLFYIFIRKYFDTTLTLALLALFSMSVYLVLYGRFSWSPNVLPFLILFSFYALLRSVSETETKRDFWFLVAIASIAITSQIHFNAFFTVPLIAVLFLFYKRPLFKPRTWLTAIGIVVIIYAPMILSDISTKGENASFFLKKVSKGNASFSFKDFRKFTVDLQYTASGYFFVNSGIDRITGGRLKEYGFQNDANLPWRILAIFLFLTQLLLLVWNITKEKMKQKKDFLVLVLLWVLVPFAYFYSLISNNFQIYPRFFLLVAPAAIILFGILLEKLQLQKNSVRRSILIIITIVFILPNAVRLHNHFVQLAEPAKGITPVETEDIFPNDKRLTLREQLTVTEYMLSIQKKNGFPIYLSTYHEYQPAFWYHLSRLGVPYFDKIDFNSLYAQGNYFLIQYPNDGTRGTERAFDIFEKKTFGALSVYTLTPDDGKIKILRQSSNRKEQLDQTIQIQELKTWNDVF